MGFLSKTPRFRKITRERERGETQREKIAPNLVLYTIHNLQSPHNIRRFNLKFLTTKIQDNKEFFMRFPIQLTQQKTLFSLGTEALGIVVIIIKNNRCKICKIHTHS